MSTSWVVLDMDEVQVNLRDAMYACLKARTGKNLHWEDWDTYVLSDLFPMTLESMLKSFEEDSVLEAAVLEDGVHALWDVIRANGHGVAVVTARGWHSRGHALTLDFFKNHGLIPDDLQVLDLHGSKLDVIRRYGNVALCVDDHAGHVASFVKAGIPSLLVDRPWNRHIHDFERVFGVQDIVNRIPFKSLEMGGWQ